MKILDVADVATVYPNSPDPNQWTAVIPAAGRGSRLGYDQPKILYPIAGRTILNRLIDLLEPYCSQLIFVLSPSGQAAVAPKINQRLGSRATIAIQNEPKGMADAIYQALPLVKTPQTLIIWGDQVAVRPQTVEQVMKIQEYNPEAELTLPLVTRPDPYLYYQTDRSGLLIKVLEHREGARMPKIGQTDCGVFALTTAGLKELFAEEIAKGITLSRGTKEWNFLPLLPRYERGGQSVTGLALTNLEETIGVNDQRDVKVLERYFTKNQR